MGHYQQHDFPFDIRDVMTLLDLNIRRHNGESVDCDCPFCRNTKKGKLNINFNKNTYRCNYNPDHAGGMVSLYARIHGIDNHTAYREICEALRLGESVRKAPKIEYDPVKAAEPVLDLSVKHQTYSLLVAALTLSEEHKKNLMSRGLSEEWIRLHQYRSTPVYGCARLAKLLMESGCQIDGIPGFYQKADDAWTINFNPFCSGFLVPWMSIDRRIQGFQIRLDHPIEDTKYIWLSTAGKKSGTGSGSPVHLVGDPTAETVYMTEGALKGDISSAVTGRTFGCVAGATQHENLKPFFQQLKALGVKRIVDCYDMDRFTNPDVARGALKMLALARSMGFETSRLTWNPKYKGIDDFATATRGTGFSEIK